MIKFYCRVAWIVLLVLLCTSFIFSNSLKNSEQSHADSGIFVEIVESVADAIFPDNECDWNFIVRKGAHIFEFFVLGVFTTLLSFFVVKKRRVALCGALLYSVAIASLDEFIQRFTGRTSSFTDVLIDLLGACVGVVLVVTLRRAIRWQRLEKGERSCQN